MCKWVVRLWKRVQENRQFLRGPSLLRSGRPGWCRKNPPFSEAPCPVILKSTISYPTLLSSSPYRRHTKNTFCSQYCGKTKQTCRNVSIWSSGEYNGWQVSRHKPLDTTPPPLGRLANKKIYWPILCNISLLTPGSRWPGITLRGVSSVTSPSSSTVSRHWSLNNVHFSPVSSSLEVQMLFTILSLITAVLWHFHHTCTIS